MQLQVSDSLGYALPAVIARTRAALDLDADPKAINAVLGPHFAGTEGLRVPGCMDGFEVAVRAIAGQQVTVAAGRTLVQRIADAYGLPIATPYPELSRLFPSARALAQATPDALGALGITRKQRQAAIIARVACGRQWRTRPEHPRQRAGHHRAAQKPARHWRLDCAVHCHARSALARCFSGW